jgi:predicted AlkP superfamily phosphohydrolase/phosphomutase
MNYLPENDTGPDDAVHDYDGIFIYWSSEDVGGPKDGVASIYDVTPTLLSLFRIKPPANLRGNSLF